MPSTDLLWQVIPFLSLSLPAPTTTRHVAIYLFFLVLSSISLLVFLNSTISFIITDILEIRKGKHGKSILGDLVGTLGLVDELVVIISAPVWGVISDRWGWGGRKGVSALGFLIAALGLVGLSEAGIVKGRNGVGKGIQLEGWEWWWWLVLFRALFAVGAGAITTMISAVLPDLTSPPAPKPHYSNPAFTVLAPPPPHQPGTTGDTPAAHRHHAPHHKPYSPSSKLAGIVGLFSGLGALIALSIFLPLPTLLDPTHGNSSAGGQGRQSSTGTGEGLKRAYWVVASYALICGIACWFGLPHYPLAKLDRRSGTRRTPITEEILVLWSRLTGKFRSTTTREEEALLRREEPDNPGPIHMFFRAIKVGVERRRTIGISYIGGFIARTASVGLSLFIPLFVNHYFISHGLCDPQSNPADKEQMKRECQRAYILAAGLTGISQFIALLSAPVIGYLSSPSLSTATTAEEKATVPLRVLSVTSILGTIGFVGFGFLKSPEIGPLSLLFVSLLGIGQIGAIVGSLGLLGRGQGDEYDLKPTGLGNGHADIDDDADQEQEEDGDISPASSPDLASLKGSIAGVYSLSGGIGILLLTKGGGLLFDKWSPGGPFWVVGMFMCTFALVTGWEGWIKGPVNAAL